MRITYATVGTVLAMVMMAQPASAQFSNPFDKKTTEQLKDSLGVPDWLDPDKQKQKQKKPAQQSGNSTINVPGMEGVSIPVPISPNLTPVVEKGMLLGQLQASPANPNPSVNGAQVQNYSRNYQAQGAIWGALIGAIGGCLLADFILDMDCTKGAIFGGAIGAAVGVAAGSDVGKRQEVYAKKEISLNEKLSAANADLADAKATRVAAENLVTEHRKTLASLRQKQNGSQQARQDMTKQVGYMSKDLEALTLANNGLKKQLESLDASIKAAKSTEDSNKLRPVYTQLQAESVKMEAALKSMSGAIEDARVA